MAEEISIKDQIGCIDRYINLNKELLRQFDGDDEFQTADCRREMKILEEIREMIEFQGDIDAILNAKAPMIEETKC